MNCKYKKTPILKRIYRWIAKKFRKTTIHNRPVNPALCQIMVIYGVKNFEHAARAGEQVMRSIQ